MARHGEHIRKRTDGRWEGRYKAFDENKGIFIYRSVYGKDYAQAKEKLESAKRRIRFAAWEGGGTADGDMTLFSQAAEAWLSEIYAQRKPSTYVKYVAVYRLHLENTIGACRLCGEEARERQEKISDHLLEADMSESLQNSVICVANQIIAFHGRKNFSNIPRLTRPNVKSKEKTTEVFSQTEQAKFLTNIYGQKDLYRIAALLCLYTGLRLGELCSLTWADIDFACMTLTVRRTVQRISMPGEGSKSVLLETEPKSESSKRIIPLTTQVLEALSHLRNGQPYVFGDDKPLDPRTMQYRFKKLLKEAGIHDRNFHTLRHTFATNCVENGMDVKTLSELLGHSDVKITLNRYVHPTMKSKRKQIGDLAMFYGQICGQGVQDLNL